jgi:hypothetical protein
MHRSSIRGLWINFKCKKYFNVLEEGVLNLEIEVETIVNEALIILKWIFRLIHTRDSAIIKVKRDMITIKVNFLTEIIEDRRMVLNKY